MRVVVFQLQDAPKVVNPARIPRAVGANAWLMALAGFCAANSASAGPPLSIGDPGVLEPGRWEVITAATAVSLGEGHFYEAPLLDVSLGLIAQRLQVSATHRYAHADPKGDSSNWEAGSFEIGATWRFWDNEGLQLAFAPGYAFGVTPSSAELGIGDAGDVASLPLVAEYQVNDRWRLNTSAGYELVEDGDDSWSYGAAVAYACNERWELLLEIAGAANTQFEDDYLNMRAGFDFAVISNFHLLFSVATGLREPGREDELDYDVFLGMQFMF